MKKLFFLLCVAAPLLLVACGLGGKLKMRVAEADASGVVVADSMPVKLDMKDGYGKALIRKMPKKSVEVEFGSEAYDELYAAISEVPDTANIRFNQIYMPDGTADGPFGRDIVYGLAQKGMYRLVIGESLMQGEPWGGDFMVEVWLGNKVPYTLGQNYFVRNDFTPEKLKGHRILDKRHFDEVFGSAATMSALPTPIDFARQYVIAVIDPVTDMSTQLSVISVMKRGDRITLRYNKSTGEKQTYSITPFLLLIVDLDHSGEVDVVQL